MGEDSDKGEADTGDDEKYSGSENSESPVKDPFERFVERERLDCRMVYPGVPAGVLLLEMESFGRGVEPLPLGVKTVLSGVLGARRKEGREFQGDRASLPVGSSRGCTTSQSLASRMKMART